MDVVSHAPDREAEALEGVHLAQLAAGEAMSLQHYRIEPGAVVEEHSHHHEQVGYLIQGRMVWDVDGEEIVTEAGDSYAIPGGEPHRVENPGEEAAVGIELFSPPRLDPPWEG